MMVRRLDTHALALLTAASLIGVAVPGCGLFPGKLPSTAAQFTTIKHRLSKLYFDVAKEKGLGLGASIEGRPTVTVTASGTTVKAALPTRVDLRPDCPPIYNQGPFRTCTAFAVAKGLGEYMLRRRGDTTPLSASHFYMATLEAYSAAQFRTDAGAQESFFSSPFEDTGAVIAAAMATLEMGGAVAERDGPYPPVSVWPQYWHSTFVPGGNSYGPPSPADKAIKPYFGDIHYLFNRGKVRYKDHRTKFSIELARPLKDLQSIRASLAQKLPVVFGFKTHRSFYSDPVKSTGRVPMPTSDDPPLDGHAMLAVGYDDKAKVLLVRNSWGADWGEKGYCTIPYEAVERRLIRDAWTIGKE